MRATFEHLAWNLDVGKPRVVARLFAAATRILRTATRMRHFNLVTWRGESVGAAGAVTLLDAIGAGKERASADPLPDRVDDLPKDRWWAGLIGRKIASPR